MQSHTSRVFALLFLTLGLGWVFVGTSAAAPAPSVTLDGTGNILIGTSPIQMSVTFDNTALPGPGNIGYGPFIDLYFPVNGADGAAGTNLPLDGIDYIAGSATYLGIPVTETILTFPAGPLGAAPCPAGQSQVTHPYAEDITESPIVVCGIPGDKLVVFQLPFGSFTPEQPPATVEFSASMSNFADLNVPLNFFARGGFQFGIDPLDNSCCDPTFFTDPTPSTILDNPAGAITPTLIEITKTNTPPEGEVATGPNFPHTYTITVTAAPGQTITNLDVFDYIDDNIVVTGITAPGSSSITLGGVPPSFPVGPVVANGTANRIVVVYPSFTNSVSFTVSYFVPLRDASGTNVIPPNNGAATITENRANAIGDWDPLDPRDAAAINNAIAGDATCPACPPLVTHENLPLPIQKSNQNLTDGNNSPGDVIRYTLSVQVSDFFALDDIRIVDVISDGQRITGNPVMSFTQHGANFSNAVNAGNFQIREYFTGGTPGTGGLPDAEAPAAIAGDTVLSIDVSGELLAELGLSELLGGCVPAGGTGAGDPNCATFNGGATTFTITYETTIQDAFTDQFPSGDASVDHGDVLDNVVRINAATVLNTANLAPTGAPSAAADDSGSGLTIAQGATQKSIYAVTDTDTGTVTLNPPGVPEIRPGDIITFRLRYNMPSTDFEDFSLSDYLPLPVLDANEVVTFSDVIANGSTTFGAGLPAAGQAMWGPTGVTDGNTNFRSRITALGINLENGGTTPTITVPGGTIPAACGGTAIAAAENYVNFCFGDYDDPFNVDSVIDILFSVTVSDDPFADDLFLTNLVRGGTGSTNADGATSDEIVRFRLRQPILLIKKGVLDTSNPGEGFTNGAPGTTGVTFAPAGSPATPSFTGDIESGQGGGSGNIDNGLDANANGVDAGDTVRYVVTIQNTGGSAAFDLALFDTLPAGLVCNPATLNLNVAQGDGTPLAFTISDGSGNPCSFFTVYSANPGIQIVDPAEGACQHPTVDPAKAVIVITYDLTIDNTVAAGDILTNVTTLTNYAGSEGGPSHLGTDPSNYPNDDASIEIAGTVEKEIIRTSEADSSDAPVGVLGDERPVFIGEVVTYRIYTRIPEGTTNNLQLRDNTPNGLQYVPNSARFAFISNTVGNIISSDAAINAAGPGLSGNTPLTPVALVPASAISGGTSSGEDLLFSFGNVTNNENDDGPEFIVVEFDMVVNNIAANQSGTNLLNTATLRKNGADLVTSDADPSDPDNDPIALRVLEPNLTISKVAGGTTPRDAGDTVPYTITINNTGNAPAYNINVTDTLPATLNLVSLSTPASPAYYSEESRTVTTGAGGSFDLVVARLNPGDSISYTLTTTIEYTALVAVTINNTATVRWTSLPGPQGTGDATPGGSGTATGERTGSGGVNDYTASSTVGITLRSPGAAKSIRATSETHTSDASVPQTGATQIPVAIGEVVRYRLAITVPEGTSPNMRITDQLSAGIEPIFDATTEISTVNFAAGTLTSSTFGAALEAANSGVVDLHDGTNFVFTTPTYPINLVDYNSTTNLLTFNLGTIINNDSDADLEQILIEFNVVVRNTSVTNLGDIIANQFRVFTDSATGVSTQRALSANVNLRVVEPQLTLTKSVSPTTGDAGDTFTYTLTVSNANGADNATAFEVRVTDDLAALVDLDLTAVNVAPATGVTDNSNLATDQLDVTIASIAPGGSVTITLTVTLRSSATPNEIITNTAAATWTSLPGTGTTGNPTGSNTPGGTGDSTGERDGSGTPANNDYRTTGTTDITVDQVVPVKSIIGTSETHTSDGSLPNNGATPVPVAIGEVVTFQLVTSIPEGTSDDVVLSDILVPGLDYIAGSARVYTNSAVAMNFANLGAVPNSAPGAVIPVDGDGTLPAAPGTVVYDSGTREVQINLGDITNLDNDPDAEQVIVTFQVVVVNSAANDLGTIWTNTFDVSVNGNTPVTSNAVSGIVQEPVLDVTKSINTALSNPSGTTTFDGGDTVVYDIVITAGNAANQTTAFDLRVLDGVDANLDLVNPVALVGLPAYASSTDNSDYVAPGQAVDLIISELRPGDSFTVRVTATVRATVTIGQIIANQADLTWTSLPGAQGTGSTTPGASGDPTGERNGSTTPAVNDYSDSGNVSFTVGGSVSTVKSIDGTSEAHTSDSTADTAADPRPLAIGEVLTYRLVTSMPEGTSPDVQILDTLALNIEFISGSARISYSANNAMNVPGVPGILNELNPTTSVPAGLISFGVAGPRVLRFDVGQVVNNDNDNAASDELLIIEFQVVVVNSADNNLGTVWSNAFSVDLNNDSTNESTSNQVFSVVQEPVLDVTKSINTTLSNPSGTTTFDGGDTVVYDIVITAGNAANQTTAFDLRVLDGVDANLDLVNPVALVGLPAYASSTDNSDYVAPGQAVDLIISELRPGDSFTVRVTATVRATVTIGQIIANQADLTWTSLPGAQGTGSTTPGASGDPTGERNGSTTPAVNDYSDSGNVSFTVGGSVSTVKSIDGTSEAHTSDSTADTAADPRPLAIGEVLTYRLVTSMPEGTSPDVQILDTLALNIEFISGSARISYSANNAMNVPGVPGILNELNPTTSVPAGLISFGVAGPRVLRFDVGQVVNNDNDNAASDELLIIEFQVVVVNSADNNLGTVWSNAFSVDLNNDSTNESTSNQVFSVVQEPVVTATKAIIGDPPDDAFDTVTYDIVITAGNAANQSTAFDLNVVDLLDTDLLLDSVAIQVNPGYVAITSDSSTYGAGGPVNVVLNRLEPGDSVTIRIVATVLTSVSPGETIDNFATITWTSLPGPQGTGGTTPGSSGDPTGERNGSGGTNDHTTPTNTVSFTIILPVPEKSIAGTSEPATSDTPDGSAGNERPVAIGEVVRYRLVAILPESTTISLRMDDVLAAGIEFVPGTARVSYLANTAPSLSGDFAGIQNEATPTLLFPASRISFDAVTRLLSFDFGSVINNDGDADQERLILEFDVVVVDEVVNNIGQIWANDFDLVIDEGLPTEVIESSNTVSIRVVEPRVTMTKTFSPDEQIRGGTTTMTLVVSNLAASGATAAAFDLNVTDVLDDWLNVTGVTVAFNPAAIAFGSTFTDNSVLTPGFAAGVTDNIDVVISALPIDGVATITVTMQIDPNADPLLLSRTITNTATVISDTLSTDVTPDDEDREYTTTGSDDLRVVKPTLLVSKTDSTDPVAAGALMSYTVTIQNTGTPNFDATGVIFTDQLPAGFIVTLVQPSQGTCSPIVGGLLTCNLGTIASGASANVIITGRYPATTASGTIANNISYVSSNEGNNGNDGNDTPSDNDDERAEEPTTILRQVDLALTKVVDDTTPNEGDLITYTINIVNNGPSQATNVVLTDSLPAGLTFVRFVPTGAPCVFADPTLTCTYPILNVGAIRTVGIEATVNAGTAGTQITNTASVTATEPESNINNNSDDAVINIDSVDLRVVKTVSNATPSEGSTISYTITVTNLGPAPATGVEVMDNLNAVNGITYVSDNSASTSTTYNPATGVWSLTGITLPPGASASLVIVATVDAGASGLAQPIVNNAVLSNSDQPDTNPANNTGSANIAVGGLDLRLTKGVNNANANEGDTVIYSIVVENLGAANATNIVVLDQLDTIPVTYVSHTANRPGTTYNPVTGQWTIPSLLAGQSIRLDITVTINAGTAGTTITNVASISSVDQSDSDPTNNSDDATVTVGSTDVGITKTVDNATPGEGNTIIYSLTVVNNGPATATGVTVTDNLNGLPLTYVSDNSASLLNSVGAPTSYNPATGLWTVGTLNAGASLTLQITVTVNAGTSGTNVTNFAQISGIDQPDTNPNNDVDDAVIAVSGLDLRLTKDVDNATPDEGDTLVYSITLENLGPANATNIVVTDDLNGLPLSYVSDNSASLLDSLSAPTSYNPATGAWSIGQLDAGASLTLQITVTVNAGTSGTSIVNNASITAVDQPDSNPNNNADTAVANVGGVDLAVTKVVDNPTPAQGSNVTYTITVVNNGPGTATGVVLSEDLPLDGVNLSYISHVASQGTFVVGTPGTWNIGTLTNGQSVTLTLTVRVEISDGQILNVASILTVDQPDSDPSNNRDDATITLNGVDLAVVKTVDNPTPETGDTITYSVVAANNGPATATGVVVVDILPAGVNYVSDNAATLLDDLGAATSYNVATGDWTIGTLNAGSSRTLTITVTVLVNGGQVINTAEISGNEPESDPSNNIDDAIISIDSADLSLIKSISTTTPQLGDFFTYTVTVSNAGPNTAFNVAVTDYLPSTVAYSSHITSQGSFNPATGVWTVGTLPVNGAATLQLTVQLTSLTGTFVNVAEVSASDQSDPDSTPNNLDPSEDDYAESSFLFDPPFGRKVFDANGLPELEWTIVWVNPNTDPLAVTVTDPIPAGTSFVNGSLSCTSPGTLVVNTCSYDIISNSITFSGTIFPDPGVTPATIDSATNPLVIRFRVIVDNTVREVFNEATLRSVNGDNVTASSTWTRPETPEEETGGPAPSQIELTKYADPPIAFTGETLTWVLEVRNPSSNTATGVVVTDTIPDGLIIEGTEADAGTVNVSGQLVTWEIGNVGAGQTLVLRIVTRVSEDLSEPVTNTALANGSNFEQREASATAFVVFELPATGETPWWRDLVLASLFGGTALVIGLWARLRS